jgi:hypothetical protein
MDDKLIAYVRDSAARGITAEVARQQLTSVGWDPKMVDNAILSVYPSPTFSDLSTNISNSVTQNRGKWVVVLSIIIFFSISSLVIGAILFMTSPGRSLSKSDTSLASTQESNSSLATLPNSPYQTYINDEYNFRLTIPTDWSYKEYNRSTFGEFRIAFGLKKNLPNDYFGDGDYLWLRAYPISSRDKYGKFTSEIEKGGVKNIHLAGLDAFDTGKMVGLKNGSTVFELHPPTDQASDGSTVYDEISQRIIASWRFIK